MVYNTALWEIASDGKFNVLFEWVIIVEKSTNTFKLYLIVGTF